MAYPDQGAEKKVAINFTKKRSEVRKGRKCGGEAGPGSGGRDWYGGHGLA